MTRLIPVDFYSIIINPSNTSKFNTLLYTATMQDVLSSFLISSSLRTVVAEFLTSFLSITKLCFVSKRGLYT